jgi:predicted  nucleic acid-binding Zn-ribbon protein
MPYSGVPGELTEKMESCVTQVMSQGKDKDAAIRICKTSLTGSFSDYPGLKLTAATEEDIAELQLSVEAAVSGNAILKFVGAKLAMAEVNKNRDGITPDGIKQMASTIRLMPLTEEHENEPRGIFTQGYVDESGLNCLVDGFIWAGHFPAFAEEVQSGKRKLSMDCDARFAVCGECGSVFTSTLEYCEHMRQRPREAVRWLHDLTAVAGGAVLHPAGTGTIFPGKDGFLVVSHDESVVTAPEEPLETVSEDTAISAEGDDNMKVKCPKCEHEFNVSAQAEELQAKLDAALADLQAKSGLEAEVADFKAKLENEQRVVTRFVEMSATAGIEVAQETLETLRVADQGVYETLKAMAGKIKPETPKPAEPPVTVIAADESKPVSAGDQWSVEV